MIFDRLMLLLCSCGVPVNVFSTVVAQAQLDDDAATIIPLMRLHFCNEEGGS